MAAATATSQAGTAGNAAAATAAAGTTSGQGDTSTFPPNSTSLLSEPTTPSNITISHLATLSSRLFLAHLESIPYAKTLILDPTLAGPLGLVIDAGSLKSVGVERMFWMEEKDGDTVESGKNVNAPTKAVVYVCRPDEKWLKVIKGEYTLSIFINSHHDGPN